MNWTVLLEAFFKDDYSPIWRLFIIFFFFSSLKIYNTLYMYNLLCEQYIIECIRVFVEFSGKVFQQTIGISLGTNSARRFFVLVWSRLYTGDYKTCTITLNNSLISHTDIKYVLSLTDAKFLEFLDVIYPSDILDIT